IAKKKGNIYFMCPVCLGNLALLASGASSTGGLTAFALGRFLKKKQNKRGKQNENCKNEIEPQNRVSRGVGSYAPATTREGEGVDPRPRCARCRASADAVGRRGEEV